MCLVCEVLCMCARASVAALRTAPLRRAYIHSNNRSFVRSFVRSFIRSSIHPSIHAFIHSFIPFIHSESVRAPRAARSTTRLLSPHSFVVLRTCGLTSSLRMSSHPTVLFPQGSGDVEFAAAFRRLSEPLRVALVEHELDDAGLLKRSRANHSLSWYWYSTYFGYSFPRSSFSPSVSVSTSAPDWCPFCGSGTYLMRAGRASHTHGGYPRGLKGQNAREFSGGYTWQGSRGSPSAGASRVTFLPVRVVGLLVQSLSVVNLAAPMYHLIRSQVDRTEIAAWRTHTAAA